MPSPEIALLISCFQRPLHLKRALLSVASQRGVDGKFELVVTDDGSVDDTRGVVEEFARTVDFPVTFTTHPHGGFQLSRCRNEGTAASTAPYLLFTDGDCLLPPDHVARHLEFRRQGTVVMGDCYRLDRDTSARITTPSIFSGEYLKWIPQRERRRLRAKAHHAWWYQLVRYPMRPRLTGNNIGVWREDLQRVNGFDENYVGWGLEDRDLQRRLSRLDLRFRSILDRTIACHMWHPTHPTFARNNEGTANLAYYRRTDVPTRCQNGLAQQKTSNVTIWPGGENAYRAERESGLMHSRLSTRGEAAACAAHVGVDRQR